LRSLVSDIRRCWITGWWGEYFGVTRWWRILPSEEAHSLYSSPYVIMSYDHHVAIAVFKEDTTVRFLLCGLARLEWSIGRWWNSFIGLPTFGHVQRKGKFTSKSGVILTALTAIGSFYRCSCLHVEALWYSDRLEHGCCMHVHTISTTSCVQAMRTLVKCTEEIRFGMNKRKLYEWV